MVNYDINYNMDIVSISVCNPLDAQQSNCYGSKVKAVLT